MNYFKINIGKMTCSEAINDNKGKILYEFFGNNTSKYQNWLKGVQNNGQNVKQYQN